MIAGAATLPPHRRRGLGRGITWAAVAEGAARGCTAVVLRALGVRYAMYRGMGFVHVCNQRMYAVPG